MALLLNDGFGLYDTGAGGLQVKGWIYGASVGITQFGEGRVSTSRFVLLSNPTSTAASQTFAAFSGATSIFGCAIYIPTAPTAADRVGIVSAEVGTPTDTMQLDATPAPGGYSIQIRKNGTLIAALAGVYAAGVWYYIEMKVLWAAAGQVTVRVDGTQYYDAAIALAAPTAGLKVGLRAHGPNSGAIRYADLLIMDGSGSSFNGFQGDVTIETVFANGAGANNGWSGVVNPVVTAGIGGYSRNGGVAFFSPTTFNSFNLSTFVVGEDVVVSGIADASFNGTWTLGAVTPSQLQVTQTGLPNSNGNSGGSLGAIATVPASFHYRAVREKPANDGDTSYVFTSNVGDTDTYAMGNLVTSASSAVLAVRPVLVARKESAAIAGIAAVARSAGTDYPGVAIDPPNTLVFVPISDTLTTDPATGTTWTRAAVNAIEVGPRKTA